MDIYQGLSLGLLVAIGAETTYLIAKQPANLKRKGGAVILLDTSVLIDGRIISVAKAGFVGGTLIVPRSVIAELQYMADNADHDKRTRARYGLDVIQELQQMKDVAIEVLQDSKTNDVDAQLVILAKKYNAELCTIDYNLNKVAQVEGVKVLNINELAQALRATHLPGERYKIQLVQKGSDSHQGVGYLEDGTMVVVEQGSPMIGQEVYVEFTRVLQTQAGRMMFAKRVDLLHGQKHGHSEKPQAKVAAKVKSQPQPQQAKKQAPQKSVNQGQNHSQPQPKPEKHQQKQQHNKQNKRKESPEDSLIALARNQEK